MAYDPAIGSVVAFQSQPSSLLVGASIIGTVPVNIVAGGTIGSVSGTVGASIIGLPTFQTGNNSVITVIQGSVAVQVTPTANQSVSGTVGASVIGLTPVNIVGSVYGTVAITSSVIANLNSTNASVISVPQGSIAAVIIGGSIATSSPANQSVSGTVGASIVGLTPINVVGSVYGTFAVSGNASVSGTVGASILGYPNVNIGGSIAGTYQNSNTASTVTGIAMMFKQNISSSIMTEISPTFPLPITGAVAASISGTVTINSPSVYGNISGSVVAFQGTSPWIETFSNSSILAVPVGSTIAVLQSSSLIAINSGSVVTISQGSVITVNQSSSMLVSQQGTWRVSVAGVYAQGSASIVSALGQLELGVRNDNLASVLASNGQYTPFTVGTVGEVIAANAPFGNWVQGQASLLALTQQPIIAAQGAGKYVYVTGIQVLNMSAVQVGLAFFGGGLGSVAGSSIIGYTVAPANGGSNINYPNSLKTQANGAFSVSVMGAISSVYVSAQGFTSTT